MARTARFHSPEYLDQALRLIVDIGHPIEFVANKLNISADLLDRLLERKVSQFESSLRTPTDIASIKRTPEPATEFVADSDLLAIARK